MDKPWFKSKGVWLGVITALIGTLQLVAEFLSTGLPSLEGFALLTIGILKVWERFVRVV
jgi:hypothetical protein